LKIESERRKGEGGKAEGWKAEKQESRRQESQKEGTIGDGDSRRGKGWWRVVGSATFKGSVAFFDLCDDM
jgi:hypothetical protein